MKNKIITCTTLLLLLIQAVLAIAVVESGKTIPIHWNLHGEIDAYGQSYNALFIVICNVLSYAILRWLSKHPEACNYPRPFKDKEKAYANVSTMLNWVAFYLCAVFLYITIGIVYHKLWMPVICILFLGLIYSVILGIIRLIKS